MLIQEAINTLVQLAIALAVVGGAWAIFARRSAPFRQWAGLGAPPSGWLRGALLCWFVVAAVSIPMVLFGPMGELARGPGTVGGQFAVMDFGPAVLATILVVAFLKTALTEEIVFRGLIAKRLIARFGFRTGNAIQAVLFGGIHLAVFAADGAPQATALSVAVVWGLPGFAGWMMGFANERFGGGTIWPGWAIHGVGNAVSYSLFAGLA